MTFNAIEIEGTFVSLLVFFLVMAWKGLLPNLTSVTTGWNSFSESLNTRGGTIALLFVASTMLGFGVLHVMHHGDNNQASAVIVSTFSSTVGALLIALTSKEKPTDLPIPPEGTSTTIKSETTVASNVPPEGGQPK